MYAYADSREIQSLNRCADSAGAGRASKQVDAFTRRVLSLGVWRRSLASPIRLGCAFYRDSYTLTTHTHSFGKVSRSGIDPTLRRSLAPPSPSINPERGRTMLASSALSALLALAASVTLATPAAGITIELQKRDDLSIQNADGSVNFAALEAETAHLST